MTVAKKTEEVAPSDVRVSYWNARNALFSSTVWSDGGDERIRTLMSFLTRVEGWYPTLAQARNEEHYLQLLRDTSDQFDPGVLRNPGPNALKIAKAKEEFNSPLDPMVMRQTFTPWYGELEGSFLLGVGYVRMTERLWYRNKSNANAYNLGSLAQPPFSVVVNCEEVAGWFMLLWYVQESNSQQPARAWVTPNEGPWTPYCKDTPGLWVPLDGIFVSEDTRGTWGFGQSFNLSALGTLTMNEKIEYAVEKAKRQRNLKEQLEIAGEKYPVESKYTLKQGVKDERKLAAQGRGPNLLFSTRG